MSFIVECTGDECIKGSIARLAGGCDKIRSLNGTEFGAYEDGSAFLGRPFQISTFGANQFAGPRSERSESNLVLLVRLLDAGGLEIFQDVYH